MQLIDDAEDAVSNVETEIAKLDEANAVLKAKQVEISALEADFQTNQSDFSGDLRNRVKIHQAALSTLALHHSDLAVLQARVATQQVQVLEVGSVAITALKGLHAPLLAKAQAVAKDELVRLYAPRSVGPILYTAIPASKIVRSVPPVWGLPQNSDFAVAWLRKLRIRTFEPLRKQAEVLQLDEPTPETPPPVADVPTPVAV